MDQPNKVTRDERREWRLNPVTVAYRERLLQAIADGLLVELHGACRRSTDPAVRGLMAAVDEQRAVVNEIFIGVGDEPAEGEDEHE